MGGAVFWPTVRLGLDDPPDAEAVRAVVDEVFADTVPRYPEDGSSEKGTGQRLMKHIVAGGRGWIAEALQATKQVLA